MKILNLISGTLFSVLMGSAIFAQQPRQVQPQQVQPAAGQVLPGQAQANQGQINQGQTNSSKSTLNPQTGMHGTMLSSNDALAVCLAIANKEEIQLAQFAKDKAEDGSVKDFATMLVEEHRACLDALKQISPQTAQMSALKGEGSTHSNTANESAQQNRGQSPANAANANTSQAKTGGSALDFIQLHREVAEQCVSDAKEKLTEKKGSEFDKCFVGMQLAAHAAMQTKLTVFQKHATGELKNIISDGLEKTKKHLKVAENLMEQLEENDSSNSTKKTE